MTAAAPPPALPFRVGHGFDLHRLEEGYPLIIGGIPVQVSVDTSQSWIPWLRKDRASRVSCLKRVLPRPTGFVS